MADLASTTKLPPVTEALIDRNELSRTVLQPNPDVQGTTMDGETVLLDLSSGRYYTLNRLGSAIWEHCTGQSTMTDIHAAICDRFDVAPERALDDLISLADELLAEGLLQQERR